MHRRILLSHVDTEGTPNSPVDSRVVWVVAPKDLPYTPNFSHI